MEVETGSLWVYDKVLYRIADHYTVFNTIDDDFETRRVTFERVDGEDIGNIIKGHHIVNGSIVFKSRMPRFDYRITVYAENIAGSYGKRADVIMSVYRPTGVIWDAEDNTLTVPEGVTATLDDCYDVIKQVTRCDRRPDYIQIPPVDWQLKVSGLLKTRIK